MFIDEIKCHQDIDDNGENYDDDNDNENDKNNDQWNKDKVKIMGRRSEKGERYCLEVSMSHHMPVTLHKLFHNIIPLCFMVLCVLLLEMYWTFSKSTCFVV